MVEANWLAITLEVFYVVLSLYLMGGLLRDRYSLGEKLLAYRGCFRFYLGPGHKLLVRLELAEVESVL